MRTSFGLVLLLVLLQQVSVLSAADIIQVQEKKAMSQLGINGRIVKIGSYNVATDSAGRIEQVGSMQVQTDSNGRITSIGNMHVFYQGDRISQIGSMQVFYGSDRIKQIGSMHVVYE